MVLFRIISFCIGFFMAFAGAHGQIVNAAEFPENPSEGMWYGCTGKSEVFIFKQGDWQKIPVQFARMPRLWSGFVMIKTGDMYALATLEGKLLLNPCHWIIDDDSLLLGYVCGKGTMVMHRNGDTLAMISKMDVRRQFQTDSIQGQKVYCLPGYRPGLGKYYHGDVRNWGMLSSKGEWLIEPAFDEAFEFRAGRAAVTYKGERRTIDENGAWVDGK